MKSFFARFLVVPVALLSLGACDDNSSSSDQGKADVPVPATSSVPAEPEKHDMTMSTQTQQDEKPAAVSPEESERLRKGLAGTNWKMVSVDGEAIAWQGETPTLSIDENLRLSGRICNTFRGPGDLEGNHLKAEALAMTRMACPNETLNDAETMFSHLLEMGAKVTLEGDKLTLSHPEHQHIIEYVRDGAAPPTAAPASDGAAAPSPESGKTLGDDD